MKEYNDDSIKVLSDIEHIQRVPLMYISADTPSLQMFEEIFNNSLDEALNGFATHISVQIDYESNTISVTDNGRGLPQGINKTTGVSTVEVIYGKLNAGGKYDQESYEISGGLHGVGSCVVNALSNYLEVRSVREHKEVYYRFEKGVCTFREEKDERTLKHGTKVTYQINSDLDIFSEDRLSKYERDIKTRMILVATLYKDLKLTYNAEDISGSSLRDLLPDGKYILSNPIEIDHKDIKLILNWTDSVRGGTYDSYCNLIHTSLGGDHVYGVEDAVKKVFSMDESLFGMNMILSAAYPKVKFEGQSKGRAKSKDLRSHIYTEILYAIKSYLKDHPKESEDLKALMESKKEILALRAHKRRDSKKDRRSSFLATLEGGGFVDANTRDRSKAELFTCEGLSAGGSLKQARDVETQAVMPLRGKIISAYNSSTQAVLSNKEMSTIISAIGCGIKEDCDPSKSRYNKIVHYGDPDPDGMSIVCEFIAFFAVYMPEIIRSGMLYVAITPLYSTEYKGKFIPIYDESMKEEFLRKGCKISRNKGLGEFNSKDFKEFMDPETRHLIQINPDSDLSRVEHYMSGDSSNRLDLLRELGVYKDF